jgi:hypothetical protein
LNFIYPLTCLLVLLFGHNLYAEEAIPSQKIEIANSDMKVARTLGRSYAFFGSKKKPKLLKENYLLRPGTIIATESGSLVYLEFKTNGVLVIAPDSQVLLRGITQKGLQQVSLIKGSMYVRTKRSHTKSRPPGIVANIRSYKTGYYGENYVLTFTKDKKEVSVKTGTVSTIPMTIISTPNSEKDDEDSDEGDEDDEDDEEDEDDEDDEEEESEQPNMQEEYQKLLEEQQEARKLSREKKQKDKVITNEKPIDIEFFMRGVYYNQDLPSGSANSPIKPRQYTGDVRLDWSLNRKKGKAYVYAAGWFEYGNQNEIYRDILQIFNNRKEGRGIIELNELYFLNSWENVDLSVGKKVFKMGVANIHSPADRVTPKDLYDPLNHKDLGNYMINPDIYFGSVTLRYALVPFFLPTKAPRLQNRVSSDAIPDAAKAAPNYPDPELKYFQNVLQFKGTALGWDWFLGFLYGPSQYATYKEYFDLSDLLNSKYTEEYPKVFISTFGYSTTFGKVGHYAEVLSQKSEGGQDDEFINYVLGMTYTISEWSKFLFLDQIKIIYEFSREKLQKKQYAASYIHTSTDSRTHKHAHLGRIDFEYSPTFGLNYSFDYDLLRDSKLQIYGLEWKPSYGHKVRFNYETFEGSTETVLSLIQDSDGIVDKFERFTLSYNYTF